MTVAPPVGPPVGMDSVLIAAPPPTDGSERGLDAAIIQLFRQVMQNARDALTSIDDLKKMVELNTADLEAASEREFKQYDRNAAQLDEQIVSLIQMTDADPAFDVGDQVTLIQDAWSRAKDVMPAAAAFASDPVAASVAKDLDIAKNHVSNVHFLAARMSAPAQVRQYVDEMRPGNTVSIHEILKEDIPDKAQRDELIVYMKTAHISIPGIIDVATGTVTRYETRRSALWVSLIVVFLLAVAVPVLALFASLFWPAQLDGVATREQASTFFPIVIGVWLGAAVHVAVDILKTRKGPRPDYIASVDDFKFYVNSHAISIVISLALLIAVAIGVAYLAPQLGFGGSFFAGYSADSFFDLFIGRFEKVVDAQTGTIKTALGGTE
jgi:hypothetical protein